MSEALIAQVLLGMALLLALGFHRHRAAQVTGLLWLLLAGLGAESLRVQDGALRFAPWLLLLCVAMPEPRLLSRRHAALVAITAALVGITLGAPTHVFLGLRDLAAWPLFGLGAAAGATVLCCVAAFASFGRWALSARPIDLGLGLVLLPAAVGCANAGGAAGWFAFAAALALLSILYASYRMAFIDQLTELPNRRALDETLSRLSGSYALAMVDIDHFKSFNDTYGHAAGDIVLREVARNLRRHAGGRAFRYGGEEFCVVYGSGSSRQVAERLEKARGEIESQRIGVTPAAKPKRATAKKPRDSQVSVTISGGCAMRDEQRRAASEVLKAADQALYKAKAKGRNRIIAA
jgi:diguanylate cyclase (GGDEF)-like protein